MQKHRLAWGAFVALVILHLTSIYWDVELLRRLSKLVLIPLLLLVYISSSNAKPKKAIVIALIFSFLGDALLLGTSSAFFLSGIAAFLVTQLLYSYALVKSSGIHPLGVLLGTIVFGTYAGVFLYFLFPTLGDFTAAISIYALAICSFGILAFQKFYGQPRSAVGLLLGATLFILSDSMIAINQFYVNYNYFTIEIMATYIVAQGLIIGYFINNS